MTVEATDFDSLRDLRDNALAIQEMPAFKYWKGIVEEQIQGRAKMALNKIGNLDEAIERNYQNGEGAGLMLAVMQWNLMVEGLTQEIKRKQEEMSDVENRT